LNGRNSFYDMLENSLKSQTNPKMNSDLCSETEMNNLSKPGVRSKNAFDCKVDSEILFKEFSNSLLPCVFQWKKAKSLSISTKFTYIQEYLFFLRFFSSISNLKIFI